jgi:outer membrane protein assembly factor BamA
MRSSMAPFFILGVFSLISFSAAQGSSPRESQGTTSTSNVADASGYTIREINWSGIQAIPFPDIAAVLKIQVQDRVEMSKVQATVEALRSLYRARGYAEVAIVPRFEVHEAGHWVAVYFAIREGVFTKEQRQHQ